MPHAKIIKYKESFYVKADDLPGARINWEKGKNVNKQERETSEKIDKSEQVAKRSIEEQIKSLRNQFNEVYTHVQTAEKAMDTLERFIKESAKKKFVKKLSKLTDTQGGPNLLEFLENLSEGMVQPGNDILGRIRKLLDNVQEQNPDEYEKGPSIEFLQKLI